MDLDKEQLELLSDLVEAHRRTLPDERLEFLVVRGADLAAQVYVIHPGLPPRFLAYQQDLLLLEGAGLTKRGLTGFFITPIGFRVYTQWKAAKGAPTEHVEADVRRYLDGQQFRQTYPTAYGKWELAERLLWQADSAEQLSAIGHHCREALQTFVTALVERYRPVNVETDTQKTVNRLRAVLASATLRLGDTEAVFLHALVGYWGALTKLVQRQEHDGQREGRPVTGEDARRVVFQTMCVMYEVDRVLSQ